MNFEIIEQAGLTQTEFGEMFDPPVSRVTINNWVNERSKPHPRLTRAVEAALDEIAAALESGTLPIDQAAVKDAARTAARGLRLKELASALQ